MPIKYSASTNIIRDSNREINYISTPNGVRVANQIVNDFKKGIHSFNIIGSYGTGKSSFIWALQQSLNNKKPIFKINLIESPKIEIINIVGEYKSITSIFAELFNVNNKKNQPEDILKEIEKRYVSLGKKNPLLLISIDEFGKFLEYASQNSPEKELYFIQQLSEFANTPEYNIVFLTTVHQNFDAYAVMLDNAQKQEWSKVKGRFREITFNEPIEQLLFLASEHLNSSKLNSVSEKTTDSIVFLLKKSKAFGINNEYASEIAKKLFPLDIIAGNVLTIALQKYGQNERSLFSFLESTDHTGINNYDNKNNPFYNLSCVYDYLLFNFYSYINSRYNSDFSYWASIKTAIEEIENYFDNDIENYRKIVKTIGLLNICASSGSDIGKAFLTNYSVNCLGIINASELIENLETKKTILYRTYNKRYILFSGTDLDISTALIEAGNKINEITDIPTALKKYYHLSPLLAKSYSYLNGTPRMFDFKISEYPISESPINETDGFINLIFNDKLKINEVKQLSSTQKEAIVYGFYKNSKTIKNLLFEIEKTKKVIEENEGDRAAIKELYNILTNQKNLLNSHIINNLFSKESEVIWIYSGNEIKVNSKREFNKLLSQICLEIYSQAPQFKNELVNKHKISSSINTAKKNYLKALVENWNAPELGFEKEKFPPEKTIYITLLRENGIELFSDKHNHIVEISKKSSFKPLWDYSLRFLNSAKKSKRNLAEFSLPLGSKPFKLKKGLIDFWLPTFLFIKRDDFALFGSNGYIPTLTFEVLDLIMKNPDNYFIKAFDIDGVKLDIFNSYRLFLNQNSKEKIDNKTFIETIKPFLTFYRGLSDYSKNTNRLSNETLLLRNAILNSKDPEKSFFEDFPIALGFSTSELQKSKKRLELFTDSLHNSIRELRTCYDELISRFESFLIDEFVGDKIDFEGYKLSFQNRYSNLKKHLCLPHQKTFIQRVYSGIDDKQAWLNTIAQAVIGKPLDSIRDEDEMVLYDKFRNIIHELDNLTTLSSSDIDTDKEELFTVEFGSFSEGIKKGTIRFPKGKQKEKNKIVNLIKGTLTKDNTLNIAALADILKDLLQNEKN